METYQKLSVLISEERKEDFFLELKSEILKSNWKIREDLVENYRKNTFTTDKKILCTESEKYRFNNKNIKGLLWLWDYSGFYEVFNIIPTESHSLEHKEYNFLLERFSALFIKTLAAKFNAEVKLTSPVKLINDTIGNDAFKALQAFSSLANKITGNTHHFDFERWCEFIFIIFRKKIELNTDELITWFVENGWSDEMANKLGTDFEYSIDLLEKYEQY